MDQLKEYFRLQQEIYDYFGYKEQWQVIPLDDATDYYWSVDSDNEYVSFAESASDLLDYEGNYYQNEILKDMVLRKGDYTLIYVDTYTDHNRFLMILDNSKEIKHGRIR